MLQVSTPNKRGRDVFGDELSLTRSPKRLCFETPTCSQEASSFSPFGGLPFDIANINEDHPIPDVENIIPQQQIQSPFKKRPFEPSFHTEIFPEQPRKRIKATSTPMEEVHREGFHTDFSVFGISDQQLLSWIPKSLRPKYQGSLRDAKIFSANDLRAILAAAIEETKKIVKTDYENALQARLVEQQQNFARYNEDYLGRHYHNKPVSMDYIS